MRILFDQGTPVPLRTFLVGHEVETAFERGWIKLRRCLRFFRSASFFDDLHYLLDDLRVQCSVAVKRDDDPQLAFPIDPMAALGSQ